jgi:hypothetical protein
MELEASGVVKIGEILYSTANASALLNSTAPQMT